MNEIFDKEKLEAICKKYYIKKLSLFGSTLKGTSRPDSDIDVLVEFKDGHTPGVFHSCRD